MVFVEGSTESIGGALSVFDEFAIWSGLSISLEKSTVYLAGVSDNEKGRIRLKFLLAEGKLPVKYLGLPRMSQEMKKHDYLPLVERIRSKICTWNRRFLSYAGRLQLIKVVLMSIVNFWAAVFRLPSKCMEEIEQLSSAFLWTGPVLKSTGAKVAWQDICKEKNEGGLGIRPLKEVNMVYGLKLIWRMLSGDSLWGKWVKMYLLKKKTFWEIKINTQVGSWMWRKMLKLREVAKSFYMKAVVNGRHTSFWYDRWSDRGVIMDLLGDRGIVDMGIRRDATVEEAVQRNKRRGRYRSPILNEIEAELNTLKEQICNSVEDTSLWRESGFKSNFSTYETWRLVRETKTQCDWAKGIWFSQATPKFSFITWLAMLNRMSTMDRVSRWNQEVDTVYVLCKNAPESRDHLYFECSFSSQVWEHLVKGILRNDYTTDWHAVVRLINDQSVEKKKIFCIRYAFQTYVYSLWRERNKIKLDDKPMPLPALKKILDLVRAKGRRGMEEVLQFWFSTRL